MIRADYTCLNRIRINYLFILQSPELFTKISSILEKHTPQRIL
jgi:hypothetical protein